MMSELSHYDETGASRMVNVAAKETTFRMARAEAWVAMRPETMTLIRDRKLSKGNVLEVARLAGIMAAKRTDELIPLCHTLGLDGAEIEFEFADATQLRIEVRVSVHGRTGVEMEALVAASVCALTVYDMCKAVDREMEVNRVRLLEKVGGKSGHFLGENQMRSTVGET